MEPADIARHLNVVMRGFYKAHYTQKQRFHDYVKLFHVKHHGEIYEHHIINAHENSI